MNMRRLIWLALALAVLLVLLWRLTAGRTTMAAGREQSSPSTDRPGRDGRRGPAPMIASRTIETSKDTYGIKVHLEKEVICHDEEIRIDIEGVERNGQRLDSLVSVVSMTGAKFQGSSSVVARPSPLFVELMAGRMHFDPQQEQRLRDTLLPPIVTITVRDVARDNEIVLEQKLPIEITECNQPTRALAVSCRAKDQVDHFECVATPQVPFTPMSFHWDLGDGRTLESTLGNAVLGYDVARSQNEPVSTFIVTVTAKDASGESLGGRTSVQLENHNWSEAQANSTYTLLARFPAYPEFRNGSYVSHVEIENPFDEPITFTRAELRKHPCLRAGATEIEPPDIEERNPSSLMGADRIDAHGRSSIDWSITDSDRGAYCGFTMYAEGTGEKTKTPAIAAWKMPMVPTQDE